MLMNCKRKIHEKLVFENAPQNPEAIKGIRAYLLALLSYATMSKRCENADFDLHIDIEGDETLFETEDESAGEIIQKLGNHGGFPKMWEKSLHLPMKSTKCLLALTGMKM